MARASLRETTVKTLVKRYYTIFAISVLLTCMCCMGYMSVNALYPYQSKLFLKNVSTVVPTCMMAWAITVALCVTVLRSLSLFYKCMYVCMYVCTYVYACRYMYVSMCVCMHVKLENRVKQN